MMRVLFTILVTCAVGSIELFDHSNWSKAARREVSAAAGSLWTGKDLRISAVDVDERTVRNALPLDRANPWWLANLPFIEAKLLEEPTIAHATVARCADAWMTPGCFEIKVRGRSVEYYTTSPEGVWLVSNDGAFIRAGSRVSNDDLKRLVSVQGLLAGNTASEITRSRFFAVRRTLEYLRRGTGAPIREVALVDEGELLVVLSDPALNVKLSLATEENTVTVEGEVARLAKLLREFKGKGKDIELVDLVYPKMAVLRFRRAVESQ